MRFYFDVISPYAHIANSCIHELAAAHGREIEYVPVLFAALLDAYGHKGPAEIPPKRVYTFKHAKRCAHDLGVPLAPPPAHPFNPLLALRLCSIDLPASERRKVIDLMFARTWITREGVTDPEAVARSLEAVDLPGPELVERAGSSEIKSKLRAQTEEAKRRGVFGVPSIEVDEEIFWGQDALPHVDRFLRGEDPITPEMLASWVDIPAQAHRPGSQR